MSAAIDTAEGLKTVPGAMQTMLSRTLPDGSLIEFEFAPAGWTTKKGTPRQQPWRAYQFTPPEGERERMPSVSTILDTISPKGGLPRWSEAEGIKGAHEGVRLGELTLELGPLEWVERVRGLKLGADRARDDAADRGLNVHALLENYFLTGEPPKVKDHPPEQAGYIMAMARWLLAVGPEPIAVEELVCDPDAGYAGRRDFRARVQGLRIGYDFKTQERGQGYSGAHTQLRLYERAGVACGDDPSDGLKLVIFAENGQFREMDCLVDDYAAEVALRYWKAIGPVDSACESANRLERKTRP